MREFVVDESRLIEGKDAASRLAPNATTLNDCNLPMAKCKHTYVDFKDYLVQLITMFSKQRYLDLRCK